MVIFRSSRLQEQLPQFYSVLCFYIQILFLDRFQWLWSFFGQVIYKNTSRDFTVFLVLTPNFVFGWFLMILVIVRSSRLQEHLPRFYCFLSFDTQICVFLVLTSKLITNVSGWLLVFFRAEQFPKWNKSLHNSPRGALGAENQETH